MSDAKGNQDVQKVKKRSKRPILVILLTLILLLFLFNNSITYYAENAFGNILVQILEKEFDNQYKVTYRDIRFNIFRYRLDVKDFRLYSDTTANFPRNQTKGPSAIDVNTSSFLINFQSLFELLFEKTLTIQRLNLDKPHIKIVVTKELDSAVLKKELDIDAAIQQTLKQLSFLRVNALNIDNASLSILQKKESEKITEETHIGNISLALENLGVDQGAGDTPRYDLNSTFFELEVVDEEFQIGDYVLVIDQLRLSKNDSLLSLKGIRVESTKEGNMNEANLGEVSVSGLDVFGILTKYELDSRKFRIDSGFVKMDLTQLPSTGGTGDSIVFNEVIKIDSFKINDLNIETVINIKDMPDTVLFENLSLDVTPVEVSSRILQDPLTLLKESEVVLKIHRWSSYSNYYRHRATCNEVELNTLSDRIFVSDLRMIPEVRPYENYYEHRLRYIGLYGIDHHKFLNEKIVEADSIVINSSKVDFRLLDISEVKPLRDTLILEQVDPAPVVRSIVKSIKVAKIVSQADTLYFNTDNVLGSMYNVTSTARELDYETDQIIIRKALFGSIIGGLDMGKVRFKTNNSLLTINRLRKTEDQVFINNVYFNSGQDSNNIIARVKKVQVDGSRFISDVLDRDFNANTVLLDGPEITIASSGQNNPDQETSNSDQGFPIDTLQVGKFRINNGKLNFTSPSRVVKTEGFSMELGRVSSYKGTSTKVSIGKSFLSTRNITGVFNEKDSLKINNILFSSVDSVFRINQTRYRKHSDGLNLQIKVPNYNLSGLDPNLLINQNLLQIKSQKILNPEINLVLTSRDKATTNEEKTVVPDKFDFPVLFENERIEISNGVIQLTSVNQKSDTIHGSIPTFSVAVNKLNLRREENDLSQLFNKIDLQAKGLNIIGINQVDTLHAGRVIFMPEQGLFFNDVVFGGDFRGSTVDLTAKSIALDDSKLLQYINEPMVVDEIDVYNPVVKVYLKPKSERQKQGSSRQSKSTKSDPIKVNYINVRKGHVYLNDNVYFKNVDVNVVGFNSERAPEEKHLLLTDNMQLRMGEGSYRTPDGLNEIRINNFIYSTFDGGGSIQKVTATPMHSRMEYGFIVGKQTDWINASTGEFRISGFDIFDLFQKGEVNVDEVELNDLNMLIFRDKHVPFNEEQRRFLPQTILRSIKIPLRIGKTTLNNAFIAYEELAQGYENPGRIYFKELNGSLINFTNKEDKIKENSHFKVNAVTNISDVGTLEAEFDFRLDSLNDFFTMKAHMGPADLTRFNQFMENNLRVFIKSGTGDDLFMKAQATNEVGWGYMDFLYHDLKISVIGKENFDTKGIGPAMLSFFANSFFINTNNPHFLRTRDGDVYSLRDKRRSVFNYMARIALSGVVSSIGAKNNRKEIKKMNRAQEEERKRKARESKNNKNITSKSDEKLNR